MHTGHRTGNRAGHYVTDAAEPPAPEALAAERPWEGGSESRMPEQRPGPSRWDRRRSRGRASIPRSIVPDGEKL